MLTNESGIQACIPFPSVFNPLDGLQRCCSFGISAHPYLQLFYAIDIPLIFSILKRPWLGCKELGRTPVAADQNWQLVCLMYVMSFITFDRQCALFNKFVESSNFDRVQIWWVSESVQVSCCHVERLCPKVGESHGASAWWYGLIAAVTYKLTNLATDFQGQEHCVFHHKKKRLIPFAQIYMDGTTTMSMHKRKASLLEFYGLFAVLTSSAHQNFPLSSLKTSSYQQRQKLLS